MVNLCKDRNGHADIVKKFWNGRELDTWKIGCTAPGASRGCQQEGKRLNEMKSMLQHNDLCSSHGGLHAVVLEGGLAPDHEDSSCHEQTHGWWSAMLHMQQTEKSMQVQVLRAPVSQDAGALVCGDICALLQALGLGLQRHHPARHVCLQIEQKQDVRKLLSFIADLWVAHDVQTGQSQLRSTSRGHGCAYTAVHLHGSAICSMLEALLLSLVREQLTCCSDREECQASSHSSDSRASSPCSSRTWNGSDGAAAHAAATTAAVPGGAAGPPVLLESKIALAEVCRAVDAVL